MRPAVVHIALLAALLAAPMHPARAQDLGTLTPKPLPPLARPDDPTTPAKQLFARKTEPSSGPSRAIGFYDKGCLSGAVALPMDGDAWQVMRPSRNRNWGHRRLIDFVERTARALRRDHVWPGLLIGDMAQPRGGPMINGHASHQIGLDVDIWDRPMPDRVMTRDERELSMSTEMVRPDGLDVDPSAFTPAFVGLLRGVALQPEVERIFVNPAIKKALCRDVRGDRGWLSKIRPEYGHDYHFHVRISCPAGETSCVSQAPVRPSDGCDETLAWWFQPQVLHPKPAPPRPGAKPPPQKTLASLPAECRAVLAAP